MFATGSPGVTATWPRVNVTLPAYNAAAHLATSVRRVVEFLAGLAPAHWEVVLAENGSTDRTRELAERLAGEFAQPKPETRNPKSEDPGRPAEAECPAPKDGCRLPGSENQSAATTVVVRVLHRAAAGRGGALRAAWLASDADLVSYMDVDLSTDLAGLPALLAPLRAGTADLAVGSRLLPGAQTTRGWKRELLSRGYNRLLHTVLGLRVADAQCGFKALTRAAARALVPRVRDEGWFFDTELLWLAQREGWRVAEIPVRWVDHPRSTVRLAATVVHDLCGVMRLWCAGRRRPLRPRAAPPPKVRPARRLP